MSDAMPFRFKVFVQQISRAERNSFFAGIMRDRSKLPCATAEVSTAC